MVDHKDFIREYRDHAGPDAILTPEALKNMFNPMHTWIEYVNRLFATPIALGAVFLLGYVQIKKRKELPLLLGGYGVFLLVATNAIVGMLVVKTGLKEGVITLHMALAILLLCLLVYLLWRGADKRPRIELVKSGGMLKWTGWILFILVVIEGIMGSQVRELTDALLREHPKGSRADWIQELEQSVVYLIHRSFSWGILLVALLYGWLNYKMTKRKFTWVEGVVVGMVLAQMVLGLLLAQVGVYPVVQVLHIGLSSFLVSSLFYWLLCMKSGGTDWGEESNG